MVGRPYLTTLFPGVGPGLKSFLEQHPDSEFEGGRTYCRRNVAPSATYQRPRGVR